MNLYEQGFSEGEKQAFEDRKWRRPERIKPEGELQGYARGWWDGYLPRSSQWGIRLKPNVYSEDLITQ